MARDLRSVLITHSSQPSDSCSEYPEKRTFLACIRFQEPKDTQPMARLIKLLGLVLATALSFWLLQTTTPPPEQVAQRMRHTRDHFASHSTTTVADALGRFRYRVQADFLEHFPDDDSTDLAHLYITLFHEGEPSWFIAAEKGRVSAKGEEVWLLGQVQIRQPPGTDAWTLDTSEVLLRPTLQYAQTDKAVTIRHPQAILEALGMRVYLREKRVEWLHNVRGRYEPPSSKALSP